jgi:hypothetical protein
MCLRKRGKKEVSLPTEIDEGIKRARGPNETNVEGGQSISVNERGQFSPQWERASGVKW